MSNIVSINEWNDYTKRYYYLDERSELIDKICRKLNVTKILEVGCNTGNNLKLLQDKECHGLDMCNLAILMGEGLNPHVKFTLGEAVNLPYPEGMFDIVITRGLLIHIPKDQLGTVLNELRRVSKKYILNLEYFGEDGKAIDYERFGDNYIWFRNMPDQWMRRGLKVLDHIKIEDLGESRVEYYTLVHI